MVFPIADPIIGAPLMGTGSLKIWCLQKFLFSSYLFLETCGFTLSAYNNYSLTESLQIQLVSYIGNALNVLFY